MSELIALLLLNSLYIIGLRYATDYSLKAELTYGEGEILGKLGYYATSLPWWIYKPLIGCVMCMSSIHSFPYWIIYDFTLLNGCIYILYIFALCGLNLLIDERRS